MRPAFSSTRQAAAFGLLLLAVLLLPLAFPRSLLPPRSEVYSSIWWANGDFPYIDQQVFRTNGEIDVLFIGASHLWGGINTPEVQAALGRALGRPAVARTFGWGGPGYDQMYFITADLLAHRRVRLLVLDDVYADSDAPHALAPHWFRYGDDWNELAGLPSSLKAAYYLASITGMPRTLLGLVRPNLPAEFDPHRKTYWEIHSHELNPVASLGAGIAQIGFRAAPLAEPDPFVPFTPQTGARPADVCVYSPATASNFSFATDAPPPGQRHFLRKFVALAQTNGCQLVMLHVPTFAERRSTKIVTSARWPDLLPPNAALVGIPPATLFHGLSDEDVRKLYSDSVHFNQNGQEYFTKLVLPTLLRLYDSGKTF